MNIGTEKQSPLVAFAASSRPVGDRVGVRLVEHPFAGYYNLRCDPDDPAAAAAFESACGVALPAPNRFNTGDGVTVYWLGPDEFLLHSPDEDDRACAERLREALGGQPFALTDISSGMTHLHAGGEYAERVLRQGTPLDIHPRVFGAGQCAQTVMAKAGMLIARAADGGFDLFVRRSFGDYLFRFLDDAAHDYGLEFERTS